MSGRPFEIVIDGKTMFCIAYEREHERRAALSGRLDRAPPVETPEPLERPRGRPSFDSIIEEAVELIATELETLPTVAARARRVLRVIAQTADAEDIPSRDTVERFLRDRPARQKIPAKLAAKITRVHTLFRRIRYVANALKKVERSRGRGAVTRRRARTVRAGTR
jgi:hypothetical protein